MAKTKAIATMVLSLRDLDNLREQIIAQNPGEDPQSHTTAIFTVKVTENNKGQNFLHSFNIEARRY